MVTVNFIGGLGENLFQYCFGRILAERFGYSLNSPPIWGFPNTRYQVIGENMISPAITWTGVAARDWRTGEQIPEIGLQTPLGARLLLKGWFQRLEYYDEHIEKIKQDWLKPDIRLEARDKDELAVCIRLRNTTHWQLTEDEHLMAFPPPVYRRPSSRNIRELLEGVSHSKLHIITDAPRAEIFDNFRDSAEFHNMGDWEDLRFAGSFNKIAFAGTAFDWWAAVLSEANEIYALPSRRELLRQNRHRKESRHIGFYDTDLRYPFDQAITDWDLEKSAIAQSR